MSVINIALIFTVLILFFLCLYFQKPERNQHLEVIMFQKNRIELKDIDTKEIISLKGSFDIKEIISPKGGCENDENTRIMDQDMQEKCG